MRKFGKQNHNYMAIPRYSRPLGIGTFDAVTVDGVQSWYGAICTEETTLTTVVFEDETVDFTGVTLPAGFPIYGNIKSLTITGGKIVVNIYG